MAPLVRDGILVARTADQIEARLDEFYVYEIDGMAHACVALHTYGDGSAEIAAVAVDRGYTSLNIGRRLVSCCLQEARRRGASRVFVLTTQTADWFDSVGFGPGTVEDLSPGAADSLRQEPQVAHPHLRSQGPERPE